MVLLLPPLALLTWLVMFSWAISRNYPFRIDVQAKIDGTPVMLSKTGLCAWNFKFGWGSARLPLLTTAPTGRPGEMAFLVAASPCGPSVLRAALDWAFFADARDYPAGTIWLVLTRPERPELILLSSEDPAFVVSRARLTRLPVDSWPPYPPGQRPPHPQSFVTARLDPVPSDATVPVEDLGAPLATGIGGRFTLYRITPGQAPDDARLTRLSKTENAPIRSGFPPANSIALDLGYDIHGIHGGLVVSMPPQVFDPARAHRWNLSLGKIRTSHQALVFFGVSDPRAYPRGLVLGDDLTGQLYLPVIQKGNLALPVPVQGPVENH